VGVPFALDPRVPLGFMDRDPSLPQNTATPKSQAVGRVLIRRGGPVDRSSAPPAWVPIDAASASAGTTIIDRCMENKEKKERDRPVSHYLSNRPQVVVKAGR
jgi:hypothetical protein